MPLKHFCKMFLKRTWHPRIHTTPTKHSDTWLHPFVSPTSQTLAVLIGRVLQVPFQDALDLVRNRKVYLKAGYVYIPHQDIVITVLNDFRTQLSKALAVSGPPPYSEGAEPYARVAIPSLLERQEHCGKM